MSRADFSNSIAIAGAGIIGMSLAWRLAQAGFKVSVYDQGKVGAESSWAGAGMLAPGGEFEVDSSMARLAIESRSLFAPFVKELERTADVSIDLQEAGALDIAYSEGELHSLQEKVRKQKQIGIEAKQLDAKQIRTYWPRLRTESLAGGYFYRGDALVNPREVVTALRIAAEKMGVVIREGCPLREAAIRDECVGINDEVCFGALVIAAGAWSGSIALHGVPPLPFSEPVRGHLVGYHQPEQTCQSIIRHGETYMLQRANGLLIVGASVERVGFDGRIDDAAVRKLQREAGFVMPHLVETTPTEVWNGFRPRSDELQLGPWHSKRVYLAYGHYRNGILLAPVTAKRLTEQISANLGRP